MAKNFHVEQTEQSVLNQAFDKVYKTLTTTNTKFDGTNMVSDVSTLVALKVTTSGSYTYIAVAPIGTSQSASLWQAKRIYDDGTDVVITWADGDADFDNVATDLTALTYS